MEDIVVKMLDLESEINADIDSLLTLKQDITAAIKSAASPDHKILLELRYLAFKPWGEIASAMNYSKQRVFQIHSDALKNIRVKGMELE
jgi:DNA-directed RNA polymerase specialized sigma subunit